MPRVLGIRGLPRDRRWSWCADRDWSGAKSHIGAVQNKSIRASPRSRCSPGRGVPVSPSRAVPRQTARSLAADGFKRGRRYVGARLGRGTRRSRETPSVSTFLRAQSGGQAASRCAGPHADLQDGGRYTPVRPSVPTRSPANASTVSKNGGPSGRRALHLWGGSVLFLGSAGRRQRGTVQDSARPWPGVQCRQMGLCVRLELPWLPLRGCLAWVGQGINFA